MSNLIVILGESGTGKSTSIRNLNPRSTFIINPLSKPLPMRGYKKKYSHDKKNYLESDSYECVSSYLTAINDRRPEINTVVIDDFSFMMNNEFMWKCKLKGYEKFTDMATNVFNLLELCRKLRDDLTCYIMCHTEKDHSGIIKPKTVGKMTSDYVGIAERVSIVLHTRIVDGAYGFMTQCDGVCVAKSPHGMFEDFIIDNDLHKINEIVHKYYNDELTTTEGEV